MEVQRTFLESKWWGKGSNLKETSSIRASRFSFLDPVSLSLIIWIVICVPGYKKTVSTKDFKMLLKKKGRNVHAILFGNKVLFNSIKFHEFLSGINKWSSLVAQLEKNPPEMWETWVNPWVGKIAWRKEWLPTPVFWPGEFHGLYSPWSCKESNTTEWLSLLLLSGINSLLNCEVQRWWRIFLTSSSTNLGHKK